jgi:hypothetical protein
MDKFNIEKYLDFMKTNAVEPDFNDGEYEKLMAHFRNNELNQFYFFIIQRILLKRNFTVSNDKILTELTAILADKVGKTSTDIQSDEQIITLIIELYNLLLVIDITEFIRNRF